MPSPCVTVVTSRPGASAPSGRVDLDLDDVARHDDGRAGGRAGEDHVAGLEREVLGEVGDELREREEQPRGRVVLREVAVDPGAQPQRRRVDGAGVDAAPARSA